MANSRIAIVAANAVSAAGLTEADAMDTFYKARQKFAPAGALGKPALNFGFCEVDASAKRSRAEAILELAMANMPPIPKNTMLFLATTVGAIDLLEKNPQETPDCTAELLHMAERMTGIVHGTLVAAACASGQTAVAMAARALLARRAEHALVIGLDMGSEFVTAGFASLGAMSKTVTQPYDSDRDGLSLGEGAGAMLLARTGNGKPLATILAWNESCDARHITSPDLAGARLVASMRHVLQASNLQPCDIGGIIGHGTGTVYNDQSEINAMNTLYPCGNGVPLVSIKGNIGHSLGASGVLQLIYGGMFLRKGFLPPQAGLRAPAEGAGRFVSKEPQKLKNPLLLSLNVGFGGLNSVLAMEVQQ